MIRLAVCDDDVQCLHGTKKMIEEWSEHHEIRIQIKCFDNGDSLIKSVAPAHFDIIFLDIMMPLLNGMDTAREIRQLDKAVKIVFLTSSPEFALESYAVKASGYLLKPFGFEQLSEVLADCTLTLKKEPKNLLLKSACGYHKIYLQDIVYIEAQNKHVAFYLNSGPPLIITEPFYSFENKLLAQDGFFKCHRSYIVSMPYVHSFTLCEITMKSGCQIPIARGIGKAFQDAYFSFMFGD